MIKKLFETLQRKQALAKMQDPLRPDWSAWAREPGKKTAFQQALIQEELYFGFLTESSKLESFADPEALVEKIKNLAADVGDADSMTPYTYEGPDGKMVLPIFSAPCMIQEFVHKSHFLRSGYMALPSVGLQPSDGIFHLAKYVSDGFIVILNPYTRWAYTLTPEDTLLALQTIKAQANAIRTTIE